MPTTATTPLPGYDAALRRVVAHAPNVGVERVALRSALGRTLRADIHADRDQPPFDRSAMDGFAGRSGDVKPGVTYAVTGDVPAGGAAPTFRAGDGAGVLRIATGAAVPAGFDAVIPIERAEVTHDASGERVTFHVDAVRPWQCIHRRASDAKRGDPILRAGTPIGPQAVGIASTVGAVEVTVAQRPRITLITSGDEVKPPETPAGLLQPQQIRNSNGPMLTAFFDALAVPLLYHEHVPDDPERTLAAAREALSHSHLVVTVGGASVGDRDYLPWAWKRLGLHVILHGVAIQPGKPVFAASDAGESIAAPSKLVIGLPGNPVSVLATAHLFVWPVLLRMLRGGAEPSDAAALLPWRMVRLAEPMTPKASRQLFRAGRLLADGSAAPIAWHGSGDLMHTADMHGWARLPQQDEPLAAGSPVPWLPIVRGAPW